MVAINFQKQFVEAIKSGNKTQTCRPPRKTYRWKVGEALQLYTAQRTKKSIKIMDAICTAVIPVRFDHDFLAIDNNPNTDQFQLDEFAQADGFGGWDEMMEFFTKMYGRTDFVGYIIKWRPA